MPGWLSAVSWQSIVALDAFLIGSIIQGLITLNNMSYSPARWQGTLLVMASVFAISLFNVFGAKHLPLAEGLFVTIHLFAFFPVIVTLLVLAPKQAAVDVFTGFTDNGAGWPSVSLAVMVGQVSTMFVVLGSDSVAHMSEEIEDAGIIVPRAMVWSFLLNVPFTFGLLLTYLFSIGNVEEALKVMYAAANAQDKVLQEPAAQALFLGFGDSSLDFEIQIYIRDLSDRLPVIHGIHMAINDGFAKAEIEIPFPQRDLHVRSISVPESRLGKLVRD